MRLINVETYKLDVHATCPKGEYAILSHTWEDDEVSFQDFTGQLDLAKTKKGYAKIEQTIRLARKANLKWAWVDTCCIDKRSSTELSEAINSMFQWYKDSAICYAYLSDLSPQSSTMDNKAFQRCRWWSRGWTLQELIAPKKFHFYDKEWDFYEKRKSLAMQIESFTGIDHRVYRRGPTHFRVAQKLSWAAKRETTKEEDIAYCLLGLFDINMPLLYGEGDKAFIRLQEEICKTTSDFSIWAWTADCVSEPSDANQDFRGLLALKPSEFARSGELSRGMHHEIRRISVISQEIHLYGTVLFSSPEHGLWLRVGKRDDDGAVWIALTKTENGYVRSRPDVLGLTFIDKPAEHEMNPQPWEILLYGGEKQRIPGRIPGRENIQCRKYLEDKESAKLRKAVDDSLLIDPGPRVEITAAYPEICWNSYTKTFLPNRYDVGVFEITVKNGANHVAFVLLCQWPKYDSKASIAETRRWEHVKYVILRRTDKLVDFLQVISDGKMIAPRNRAAACRMMEAEVCAGWDTSAEKSRDLLWQDDMKRFGLQGELTLNVQHDKLSLKLARIKLSDLSKEEGTTGKKVHRASKNGASQDQARQLTPSPPESQDKHQQRHQSNDVDSSEQSESTTGFQTDSDATYSFSDSDNDRRGP
ncbi:hypothetical protein PFICI_04335 [Pestalotiopsis fici W106-1]|uniref:Heterokaryon incompatibility domain-containing protein n=1 Tax=Pestalotiopsis fici (strain W106-1 / CGMCC3.15140) TaxID=1229662 RepID=W3X8V4_PESFW|nr:uncharacterized protein PFICI_04335 [Pestalotiopsis fici W106-1]ETS82459.1 hypothetical protein PFICI_04335 [Pestalotiopsis fici W106-1]